MVKLRSIHLLAFFFVSWSLSSQVTADFSASDRSGCLFLQSAFTDLSTSSAGKIVKWDWQIGNSDVTVQNPSRIFGQPGKYRVCLTVTDDQGNSDTKCVDDFIVVYEAITPSFTLSDSLICKGDRIAITDASYSPNGPIVEWVWELAGNIGSARETTSKNFVNQYNVPGTFDLALTIKDDKGCTESYNIKKGVTVVGSAQVQVKPAVAVFCTVPHTTSFTLTKFDSTASYYWDFGNGQTYQGLTPPAITFSEARSYDVRIAASNNIGCTDTTVFKGLVHPEHSVQVMASDSQGCAPFSVHFSDRSQLLADSLYWDFGDGTTSNHPNVDHVFTQGGDYSVKLYRRVNGCWLPNDKNLIIHVRNQPVAQFSLDETKGCSFPFVIQPRNSSFGALSFSWSINDSTVSTDANPVIAISQAKTFDLKLIVLDMFGCADTSIVGPVELYDWKATVSDSIVGCAPISAHLEDLTQGLDPAVRWRWQISGDTTFVRTSRTVDWNVRHDGVYDVKLVVENSIGCIDSISLPGYVRGGVVPSVDFDITPDTVCVGDTVYIDDLSDSRVNGWEWTFSDGQQSDDQNPAVVFKDPGNIGVTLSASYNGCINSRAKPKGIVVRDPKADFAYRYDCADGQIHFINMSVGYDSVFWDFGIPNRIDDTSSSVSPVVLFPSGQTYYVELQVFNGRSRCSDHKRIPIYVGDPAVSFGMATDSGCAPYNLIIRNLSTDLKEVTVEADGAGNADIKPNRILIPYRNPGVFAPVRAFIQDKNGCRDTLNLTDSIKINKVKAILDLDRTELCLQDTFHYKEESSSSASIITERRWWINQLRLPETDSVWVPSAGGPYVLGLAVEDAWGCKDSTSIDIRVNQVQGAFSIDSLSCSARPVDFNVSTMVNPVQVTWDLGNGTIRHEPSFAYAYPDSGLYVVRLHLEDTIGCAGEYLDTIRIDNPVASFILDTNYYYCPPYEAKFYNYSTGASEYTWSFGDNTSNSKAFEPQHIYTKPGTYSISMIADLLPGCSDTMTLVNALKVGGPTGSAKTTIDSTCAPTHVRFDLQLDDQYDLFWDVGVGTIDSVNGVRDSFSFDYYYTNAGVYTPSVLIRDTFGCLLPFVTQPIPVNELSIIIDIPVVDFCDSLNPVVNLFNLSYSNHQIRDFRWRLIHPDTTIVTDAFEASFYLGKVGRYDVQVTAEDGFCRDTLFLPGYLKVGPKPVNHWLLPDTLACAPYDLEVLNQTVLSDGFIDSTLWILNGDTISYRRDLSEQLSSGSYDLRMVTISNAGCRDTIAGSILLKESAEVELADEIHLCYRDSVLLRDTLWDPVNQYVWQFPDGSLCADCDSIWYKPSSDGSVLLQVTNPNDCITNDSILVYFGQDSIPQFSIMGDTVLCPDEITQLTLSRVYPDHHIQWDSLAKGLNCYEDCFNPVLAPKASNWYKVEVTTDFGCTAEDSIYVRMLPRTSGILGPDEQICLGDSIALHVLKGRSPYWHISDQLSCTYCFDPVAIPDSTRTYVVGVIDSLGCNAFDTVTVSVLRLDALDVSMDTVICRGTRLTLHGSGPQPVVWLPGPDVVDQGSGTLTVAPMQSTYYHYMVSTGSCSLSDSVLVQVSKQVPFSLIGDTVCAGDSAFIRLVGNTDRIIWPAFIEELGNGNGWFVATHDTEIPVTGQVNGCLDSTVITRVMVYDLPDPGYPEAVLWLGDAVPLPPLLVQPYWSYQWSPPEGLSCLDCSSPLANPGEEGIYTVKVTDRRNGCVNTIDVRVGEVATCGANLVEVPNAFSPNGDGNNDVLFLFTPLPSISKFEVFNRWGSRLFATTDKSMGWDGRLGGSLQPAGVYAYRVTYFCPALQREVTVVGDVTLIR